MSTISLIAPLAANPAPEPGPANSDSAGSDPQSTAFEFLVAQLTGIANNVARDSDDKPTLHAEPPTGAQKTTGRKILAAAVADAEHSGETALGVFPAALSDLTVNKKEMPVQAHSGVSIELQNNPQVAPPNPQSARLEAPAVPDADEAAAPEVPDPANFVRVNLDALSAPASLERPIPAKSEKAKPSEPQLTPPGAQIIPSAVSEINRQSPLIFFTHPESPIHAHAADPRTIVGVVTGSQAVPLGKIDAGQLHPEHAFVIVSTKQLKDGSLELRLDPPELGSVRISLSSDDNGAIRALVTADRAETLDLVRRHIDVFRIEAGNHGLSNLDFRFESGSQSRSSPDPEKKKPAARLTDSFAAGFDGDMIYSAPLSGGGMDLLA